MKMRGLVRLLGLLQVVGLAGATAAPSMAPTHAPSFSPTASPTKVPTYAPTGVPTTTVPPSVSVRPTVPPPTPLPSEPPSASPTTADPTGAPTLAPTTTYTMITQRLQIALSFLVILAFYVVHACTKPSDLAQRGLDPALFKIREFRVEKRWGCKFCGFLKNMASSPLCAQCGTNQLGEQTIPPRSTARGVAVEQWGVHVVTYSERGSHAEGTTALVWERVGGEWPFVLRPGARHSELPTALALAKVGFAVGEVGAFGRHGGGGTTTTTTTGGGTGTGGGGGGGGSFYAGGAKWGTCRAAGRPLPREVLGLHLAWQPAHLGLAVSANLSRDLLDDINAMRLCFFPEKVAWFYEQIHRLEVEAMSEVDVSTEFATAYPNSVLRDSITLLGKVSPLQVLQGKYKLQFVTARSHTRVTALGGASAANEQWLQALVAQMSDPSCGILVPADADGDPAKAGRQSLELNPTLLKSKRGDGLPDPSTLAYFTALGRALAMALVSRTFVRCPLSPSLAKLLLGRPCHFLDLLTSNQALFQELLKLQMLPADAVANLGLRMPPTSQPHPAHGREKALAEPGGAWGGRFAGAEEPVTVANREEYIYRQLEHQLFGKTKPQFAALRRALFEVIPFELFAVFDHSEFLMLLNGHNASDEVHDKVFV